MGQCNFKLCILFLVCTGGQYMVGWIECFSRVRVNIGSCGDTYCAHSEIMWVTVFIKWVTVWLSAFLFIQLNYVWVEIAKSRPWTPRHPKKNTAQRESPTNSKVPNSCLLCAHLIENIGALFESLLKQEKVHVAVASFGRNDVITKAIASVLPPRLASRVIVCTPADVEGGKDGYSLPSKNPQLNLLAERLNIPTDRICFFDDDRKNIKYANDVGVNAIVADPFNEELEPHIHEHIARFSWWYSSTVAVCLASYTWRLSVAIWSHTRLCLVIMEFWVKHPLKLKLVDS